MSQDIAPDFDSMTDEEWAAFERTTLMAPDDMAEVIMEECLHIRGDIIHQGMVLPRYGILSLKARRTPMYCYGHPELKNRFPRSFNDGRHIFVSDDYMRELLAEESASKGAKVGLTPLILHHLMHMVMNHHRRFKGFHPQLANIGADVSTHAKLRLAFPEMKWVDALEKEFASAGASDAELQRWAGMAEESIIRELSGRYRQELSEQDPQDGQADPDSDAQGEGDGQGDEQDATESQNSGDSKKPSKSSKPGEGEGEPSEEQSDEASGGAPMEQLDPKSLEKALKQMGMKNSKVEPDAHNMSLKEMAEQVEDLGLSATKERLEIPDAWDYESMARKEEETRLADIDDIAKSVKLAGKAGTAGGGHLAGAAHEQAQKETEGKLSWRMSLQEAVGNSMKFGYTEDEPGDIFYIDPKDMGLNDEVYVGADLPMKQEGVVMVLMDTSGSITEELLKMFLAEVFGLIKSENSESSHASEVVLLFCDDVLRGDPILIDEHNVDEMAEKKMNVYGRGGNDIGGTIRAAAKLPIFEQKKIQAMIYFTDLGDAPPKKSDVPEGVPLTFICPPSYYQEEFIKQVKDFARVHPIEEGLEVDLTREGFMTAPGSKTKPRKGFGGF